MGANGTHPRVSFDFQRRTTSQSFDISVYTKGSYSVWLCDYCASEHPMVGSLGSRAEAVA